VGNRSEGEGEYSLRVSRFTIVGSAIRTWGSNWQNSAGFWGGLRLARCLQ
jgi:hypothetical protein